ncbi:MAG TPA: hypothetical protein DHW14_06570 [Clostridiales bacterium]|nr:hypothetical protein [Clostridiales bacterium]
MHPGLVAAILLFVLYFASWFLFLVLHPTAQIAGVPLITWSLIAVAVLGIIGSVVVTGSIGRWENRS